MMSNVTIWSVFQNPVTYYDCHINDLGYLYPGQSLTIFLYHKRASIINSGSATAVAVKTDTTQQYVTPCIVLDIIH